MSSRLLLHSLARPPAGISPCGARTGPWASRPCWAARKPADTSAKRLEKWFSDQSHNKHFGLRHDLLSIEWELCGEPSLGRVWVKDGPQGVATGNRVVIQLKYAGKHEPSRLVVYTSFPE
ncbi:hypothetical protein [Streptomyces sp. NPDC005336]|uniref:hypothetical protein n=1 Tax=Streptomyces sp. NPDC005336 TaxID=3157035 RepID=UPI0033A3203D